MFLLLLTEKVTTMNINDKVHLCTCKADKMQTAFDTWKVINVWHDMPKIGTLYALPWDYFVHRALLFETFCFFSFSESCEYIKLVLCWFWTLFDRLDPPERWAHFNVLKLEKVRFCKPLSLKYQFKCGPTGGGPVGQEPPWLIAIGWDMGQSNLWINDSYRKNLHQKKIYSANP